ncbi:MAG: hypothetical protein H0U66_14085 [Gemmatimonadaceae bacterium]|nr:hypothetical protein [Gemmatimonadaceae bacterium]
MAELPVADAGKEKPSARTYLTLAILCAASAVGSSGLACRIPFGFGAAITGAVALYCLVRLARSLRLPGH